ncbi:hypothetical protein [Nocardia sp. NPDC046763]|uniref:hypothetical protein n=1 Tax=Nocardia sp. NPDC046763 TaxID=3155256 RepID=UPI0033D0E885
MKVEVLEQNLRENPDDVDSWRAYGDWLLEKSDARGTLIQLEQRCAHVGPADREALNQEITALVREHQESWDAELPPEVTLLARRHGFAAKVSLEWSDDAPVLIEQTLRAPFVTALRIEPSDKGEDEDDWGEDENDEPSSSIDAGALATLNLGRLAELDLSYLRIGGLGAEALAVSAYFRVEAAAAENPAAGAAMGRIEVLDLRYCHIGDAGLAAIAASPSFGGVRRLRLQKNLITAEGVQSLHRFTGLTELDLRYNEIGAEGIQTLLAAPFIGSLSRLYLYRTDVGDDGAKMLASAPQLPPALRSYWRSV